MFDKHRGMDIYVYIHSFIFQSIIYVEVPVPSQESEQSIICVEVPVPSQESEQSIICVEATISGRVKLLLWAQTSTLSEMMQSNISITN
jgi:hypothetical protein